MHYLLNCKTFTRQNFYHSANLIIRFQGYHETFFRWVVILGQHTWEGQWDGWGSGLGGQGGRGKERETVRDCL